MPKMQNVRPVFGPYAKTITYLSIYLCIYIYIYTYIYIYIHISCIYIYIYTYIYLYTYCNISNDFSLSLSCYMCIDLTTLYWKLYIHTTMRRAQALQIPTRTSEKNPKSAQHQVGLQDLKTFSSA